MQNEESPFLLTKRLETHITGALSPVDIYELDAVVRKLVADLKHRLIDARLDIRDYELSETRDEQLKCARNGKKRLEHIRKDILAISEHGIFGAVDVAQLTASIDQIMEYLR